MHFDVLIAASMKSRPSRLLENLAGSAAAHGIDARVMRSYAPRPGSVLVLYGLGGRDRLPHAEAHQRAGVRYIAWDAGYWHRKAPDRFYRVSIDGFHCPQRVGAGAAPDGARWNEAGLPIANRFHPEGDVILVGNGPKSWAVGATGWAAAKAREIRAAFPARRLIYRPKGYYVESGVDADGSAMAIKIEKALDRASLVVCRHSNVAIDACRLGIPVVCEDGAAASIYPSRLDDAHAQPTEAQRLEFLHRVAWWQWSESEIARGDAWPWLLRQL